MQEIIEFFSHLTNPEWIMENGGLYIVVLIVFIETGFPFGFFLPGDSLLFIAGMVIANAPTTFDLPLLNLIYWIVLIATAGTLGNYVGYWLGHKSETLLFSRKDSWFFKKKYLIQAREFYDKKGGGAIVLARFLPIVRTFAPIVAGMVKMRPAKFSFYNVTGSFLWVISIVSAGFLLGENEWVKNNLDKIILGIVVLTTAPVFIKIISEKIKKRKLKIVSS
ncbi:MAG TPA: VTT domain-containing protein [Ferruginibacter sp.]|jgi:membrane-associated protein|nr:VTT domain-containing protein [Bacteroidota bacterium]MBS1924948.1 VTT domain-containing protein [Bacteroidota bacterium]MCC6692005.1 VTT domain-containing protein [Chitinophagaceae bacterium]HMT96794.1 VTT domain-containing protein [Ferruginibacter sp.]HMU24668.1 VTT domain-containing protein [Ferruginibacter sp.]